MKKIKINNFINRFLWRIHTQRICKRMTNFKLHEFYCNLLKDKNRSKFPYWQIKISLDVCYKELKRRKVLKNVDKK